MKSRTTKFVTLLLILVMATGALSVVSAQDNTLTLLYWQAPSHSNAYLGSGTKEFEAASVVLEPLARYDPDGAMVPWLATEIPTVENGGVTEDLLSITWNLRDDITWSDGTPFTAADVVFSADYCMTPETGCSVSDSFTNVETVEALDDHTVQITFDSPKPFPYLPFVGYLTPILQKAQFEDCLGADAVNCADQNFNPIGTGAFMVEEFRPNDVVTYVANPNYRDADSVSFDRVVLKGGGDAEGAARAVLETGEADYAWNLQVAPQVLLDMEAAGEGTLLTAFASNVERIMVNQTNPDASLGDDARSVYMEGDNAHPFLVGTVIPEALSMAIDRNIIAEQLYGAGGRATCNILAGPPAVASTNLDDCLVQDIDGANALLDEAGIVDSDGDGIREYNGIPLIVVYQTSTNAVRQSTQALIKQWWAEIGVDTELRNIDGSVFFGGDPASPDTYNKFYTDLQMFTNGSSGTDPENYMSGWACEQIAHPDNQFNGNNIVRWCSPEYDALLAELAQTGDLARRAELAIQMNDMVVSSGAIIPLVFRGSVSAHHNSVEGVHMNPWDSELWNIAGWSRAE